ncbi:MAG: 5-formyltetrahydrofolate cyclo-ligase [Cyanobacteria bacterium SID2]|nr:5-formyltetrahydrofolate cyclo-ligase [Cyanobacteria bacterium SID2]MBP0006179.1 5-formyltetrahydrofolate cyclo-ligase [Cyanobacteria bacterium SBC]
MEIRKSELRRSLLKTRQSLSDREWRDLNNRLCVQLASHPNFVSAKTVLGYFSFRREPDLTPLVSDDRTWGFPRCVEKSLAWHRWQPGELLVEGAFGIREPHPETVSIDPETVDLMLVPAVACDRRGYRLGYGGGFYDRLLSHPAWQRVPTLGIVFGFACLPELPIDGWDRRLAGVCTESQVWQVAG